MTDKRIVETYDYTDEGGKLLYQNCRYESKTFKQRRPDGNGGYVWNLDGTSKVLYRLRELLQATPSEWVFYCEGEKDTDNLRAIGLTATTAGAAHNWKLGLADFLNDRRVCIIPDNDKPGRSLALRVRKDCKAANCPEVKILYLEGLPEKGDVSDWLSSGGTKEKLLDLANTPEKRIKYRKLSEIEPQTVEYILPEVLPRGMLTLLISQEGVGKSTFAGYIASIISQGRRWANAPEILNPKGDVILFSHEEDPACVIVPRLIANGADMDRIHLAEGVITAAGKEYGFDLEKSIEQLNALVNELPETRLVYFDPITSYVSCNENSNSEVRQALKPIVDFAANKNIAVLGLSHFNKKVDAGMINRTIGSRAWSAVPRMVWGIRTEQIEDEDGHKTDTENRFLLNIKCNIGVKPRGIKFSIGEGGKVICDGERVNLSMDDTEIASNKIDGAVIWLKERLKSGVVLSTTIYSEGAERGYNNKLLDRAKSKIKAKATRTGFGADGKWFWELQDE